MAPCRTSGACKNKGKKVEESVRRPRQQAHKLLAFLPNGLLPDPQRCQLSQLAGSPVPSDTFPKGKLCPLRQALLITCQVGLFTPSEEFVLPVAGRSSLERLKSAGRQQGGGEREAWMFNHGDLERRESGQIGPGVQGVGGGAAVRRAFSRLLGIS